MLIKLMLGVLQFKERAFIHMHDLFEQLNKGQHPDTLFITCADSRIDPTLITQAHPGDLFTLRNIGNIIPKYPSSSSEAAGIEYVLNEFDIKDIIICGHTQCGAMKGLLKNNIANQLPNVASWLSHSHSVLKSMHEDGTELIEDPEEKLIIATQKNILLQIAHLKTYPLIAEKLARNELTIHGWLYEVKTGKIQIYEPEKSDFIVLESALDNAIERRKNKIITNIAMDYLEKLSQPKSAKELHEFMRLFSELKDNINPIWPAIKETCNQKIWAELGTFYAAPLDNKFVALVQSGTQIKLPDLKKFQQNVIESVGYHQLCSQLIKSSFFSPPPKYNSIPKEYCSNSEDYSPGYSNNR
ncbi:carbonic anhydrase [uncultured Legionella sp.]|uniref:carbonic anhydrase n=1 Tax=uncultured Legionella sp. TaxID=210934 RepID=UPI002611F861|nr:carbonic anhydrase [uncultured Legionella sp.]